MPESGEALADLLAARVPEIARAALGEPGAAVGVWESAPLKGGTSALDAHGSLFLLSGTARVGGAERPWGAVLKVLARTPANDDPAGIAYWPREALLHSSGLLASLPGPLRAPRSYGVDEPSEGVLWLWLEQVREEGDRAWPLDRWALAARHLGQLNGAYLGAEPRANTDASERLGGIEDGRPPDASSSAGASERAQPWLPDAPWLGGGRLRSWLESRHHPLVAHIAAAPDDPAVRSRWPRPVVDAVLRVWAERDLFLDALERLPQTFGHGDAIRRNLFARGPAETVAIDWEAAGRMALGEEVGQTLSCAAPFYDVDPADLPALDEALWTGYLASLRDAGWRGDERPVRFAYLAHAALRNLFNAVGTVPATDAGRAAALKTFGRTPEELADMRAEMRPYLLGLIEQARKLMPAL